MLKPTWAAKAEELWPTSLGETCFVLLIAEARIKSDELAISMDEALERVFREFHDCELEFASTVYPITDEEVRSLVSALADRLIEIDDKRGRWFRRDVLAQEIADSQWYRALISAQDK